MLFLSLSRRPLLLSTAISIQRLNNGLSLYTHLPKEIHLMATSHNVMANLRLVSQQLSADATQLDPREAEMLKQSNE